MYRLFPVLFLLLTALPIFAQVAVPDGDPLVSGLAVARLDGSLAQVTWQTASPVSGGVLLYSKKHQFAKGLDPFTLRYIQETAEASLQHSLLADGLDDSTEWRFQVSYQLPDGRKFDSPFVFPFTGATSEVALPETE